VSYTQKTEYGRAYKYDTFEFNVPEFNELLKDGRVYMYEKHGGKRWIYMPHNGKFTLVVKNTMDYMDKLRRAQERKKRKQDIEGRLNENRETPKP
jgi:hypothetical protein